MECQIRRYKVITLMQRTMRFLLKCKWFEYLLLQCSTKCITLGLFTSPALMLTGRPRESGKKRKRKKLKPT